MSTPDTRMAPMIFSVVTNAPFEAWKPYLLLTLAINFTIIALISPGKSSFLSFITPYALTLWSLLSISPITTAWSPPYLECSLGITCIVNLIILPRILLFEQHSLPAPASFAALSRSNASASLRKSLSAATSIWNNPRNLPGTKTDPKQRNFAATLRFTACRVSRIGLLVFLHRGIVQQFASPYFLDIELEDVSPQRESLVRRVIWSSGDITQYEVVIRMLLPINWVWMNYLCLECYHDVLSIIFVCILQADDMKDWPPPFGSITEAYTVRRFWGKFWHRITAHNMALLAKPTSRVLLRCKQGSFLDKTMVAFLIFFLSGIAHASVAWRIAEGSEIRDVMFFVANFAAVAAEVLVSRAFRKNRVFRFLKSKHSFDHKFICITGRAIGFVWVYIWFVWMIPKWQFPKLHSQRTAQLKMEMAFFFGELP